MMQILFIFCDPSLRRILQPLSNNILENKLVSDDHMAKPPRGVVGGLWVDGVSSSYSPNPEKNQFAIKKEEEVKRDKCQ
jgi:hypothetical protein